MMNTRDIIDMKIKEKKTEVNNLKTNLSETEISDTKKREHDLINNTSGEFGEGKKPTHQYQNSGQYDVALLVTDDKDSIDAETYSITVVIPEVCGAGTELVDGECKAIQELEIDCGAGTELINGKCEVVFTPEDEIPIELVVIGLGVGGGAAAGAYAVNKMRNGPPKKKVNVKMDVEVDLE